MYIPLKPLFSRHNGIGVQFTDEPTGNLDSASGLDIMRKLTALNEQGTSIILITHDNHLAQMAKRIVTIQDGRIISDMKGGAV